MAYNPQVGEIIKMKWWHGVVLDKFEGKSGKTVLRVQTPRNVFRRLNPEYIEVDLAPDDIHPATLEDMQKEIEELRDYQESQLKKLFDSISINQANGQ